MYKWIGLAAREMKSLLPSRVVRNAAQWNALCGTALSLRRDRRLSNSAALFTK